MDSKQLYKKNETLQKTLVKYIDKVAQQNQKIADLERQLKRLRNDRAIKY